MTTEPDNTTCVFGAVPYLNAAPLAHFLGQGRDDVHIVYDRPAELLTPLLNGRLDAALVPVVDVFAHPELQPIDDIGICADGDVQSVLLKCYRPRNEIRTVAPDPASKTSNALAKILLAEHFAQSVTFEAQPNPDAAVVIGDRAMCEPPAPHGDIDLAGQWKTMTDLPFVFAVWAHRCDHTNPQALSRIARDAKHAGLAALRQLAEQYARKLDLDPARCLAYLTDSLGYDVGPREVEGMRRFRELCASLPAEPAQGDAE
jgi:chorismate dehydratase